MSLTLALRALVDGFFLGLFYSVIALGLALIFGVMGIINFAHGDFIMLAAYVTWMIAHAIGVGEAAPVAVITTPLFFALGAAFYRFIVKPLLRGEPLIQIACTVGVGFVLQNIALMLFRAEPRSVLSPVLNRYVTLGPLSIHIAKVAAGVISVLLILAIHYMLTKTRLGLAIRATAYSEEVAKVFGVNTDKVFLLVTGLGIGLTGLGGSLWMTFGQVDPYLGASFALVSWIIVALGGLGGIRGLIYASMFVGVIEALTMTFISPSVAKAVPYIVFIVSTWFRPQGLFAFRRGGS